MKQLRPKEIKKKFKRTKREKTVYVIAENIQYARNVASMFRTADAAGVRRIYLTGISHTPPFGKELVKVSRSKERNVAWMSRKVANKTIDLLRREGFFTIAVELTDRSIDMSELPEIADEHDKICLVVGSEVHGVTKATLESCDLSVHIPMYGAGKSINVALSLGIILWQL
ncbi:MAG: TrmH family RNA methyltransferase [Candidatus Dojkabacteria bacterium]|nr:TrmH family RNA methyltransferase [Candidatus Dojkabacteria bacterium]MDQ7021492.1 TrmH family RNA methyltransferase [Candidatus Dojkabacteria bacterium]